MAWERRLLCEVYRGQPRGFSFTLGNKRDSVTLVSSWFRFALLTLGMFMGTERSQSQASLRMPWRFWKTQFCPGCILSKQISNLSTPTLRISYATESLLEQSPGTHWYSTACQHPDVRTVSCWPVLKSKWGEKKNQSLIMEQGCLTLWHDQFFFIYLC